MTITEVFQRDVADKLSQYLLMKVNLLENNNDVSYVNLVREYERNISIIRATTDDHRINQDIEINKHVITCLSEPITDYRLSDLTERAGDNGAEIYSPRIDIAITPTVLRNRTKKVSLGIYKLAIDLRLFDLLHEMNFIRSIENNLRNVSRANYESYIPEELERIERVEYINTRPMHLFGFEIENQKNPKHLMGDFLNAMSISKIPIVILKEERLEDCMRMLRFSKTIEYIKDVPIYNLLKKAMVLTVSQFRSTINEILIAEDIAPITTNEYR